MVALSGLSLVAAFAAGYRWRGAGPAPGATDAGGHASPEPRLASQLERLEGTVAGMSSQIAALTAAVQGRSCATATETSAGAASAPAAVASPEASDRPAAAVRAEQDGRAVVERAARERRWTARDRDRLRVLLGDTDASGRSHLTALVGELLGARDVVVDEMHGPPL